jgi:hypothetical protein
MARARYMVLGAAMLAGCSLPPDELCPCQQASCQIETHRCITLEQPPTQPNGSVIYTDSDMDRRLYCANQPDQPLYRDPTFSSDIVNTMTTTYSWFFCWQKDATPGDATIWYLTRGDRNNEDGWMPEDKLEAPIEFKADPEAFGFRRCSASQ